ncbi:MAG: RHS repeat-associated core domain-containing protein, partial [Candidatus Omnitrophota bacterium]
MIKTNFFGTIISLVVVFILVFFFIDIAYSSTITFYVYDDPERSIVSIVGNTGNTVNTYVYDAFGNIINQTGVESNTYCYNAEQLDSEMGFIFLRNRYYDPYIGRFITKDVFAGNKSSSQSLNPYVFVLNNPVNYIDPLGLKTLIINGMSPLATLTGGLFGESQAGYSGDLGRELKSLGEDVTEVLWSGNIFDKGAYNVVTEKIINASLNTQKSGEPLNVIAYSWGAVIAGEVLSATNIKVDNFITMGSPSILGGSINGRNTNIWSLADPLSYGSAWSGIFNPNQHDIYKGIPHMNYFSNEASIDKVVQTLGYTSTRINDGTLFEQFLFGSPAYAAETNFGGVSLSKTASLMLNIEDIAGAGYDEATGQVILYGRQNLSLPAMELDDLAVAVRSVYGYGGKSPQDPGVSIGTEPSDVPCQMKVRYDGQTNNTAFGSVMFESDRLLKCLTMGKDNI